MSWLIWVWLGLFIVAILVEIFTEELVSVWFAGGAFVTMVASIWIPFDLWWVQVIIFSALSLGLFLILRPILKKFLIKNQRKTNVDALIGKKATVTKRITELNPGEVKISGIIWHAVSTNGTVIEAETIVIIDSLDGNKLVVSEFDN